MNVWEWGIFARLEAMNNPVDVLHVGKCFQMDSALLAMEECAEVGLASIGSKLSQSPPGKLEPHHGPSQKRDKGINPFYRRQPHPKFG